MRIIKLISFLIIISNLGCTSFLYWPSPETLINPALLDIKPQEVNLPLAGQEKIHAWHFKASQQPAKGVFVQFHGNAENMTSHFRFFYWVLSEGYDLFVFDYRGYGQSSPVEITPKGTVEDGIAVLNHVHSLYVNQKIIAVGQSLGGAVLLSSLASVDQTVQPDVVVLDSTFLSYKDAAISVLKQRWFLYPLIPIVALSISDEYAPLKTLNRLKEQPKIVVHGKKDIVIRPELGEAVFAALQEPKQFWPVDDGVHTSAFSQLHGPAYRRKLLSFIEDSYSGN